MAMKAATGHTLYIAADQGRKPDMYQVGQAVCTMVLSRHNQQAYFFFEPFLKLDLLDLRARGYNVDRILRAKQEEARIAEEERRRALEAEEQRIKEREAEWARQTKTASEVEKRRPGTPPKLPGTMPGAFDDSPEPTPTQALPPPNQGNRRSRGFLSNFTRRLGLDRDQEQEEQLDKLLTNPEPESKPDTQPTPQSGPPKPQGPGDNGRVTSPAVVQNNLLQAIRSTRPHNSSSVFTPPQTQEVKETSTYCDSKPAQNIVSVGSAPNQMKVYLHKDLISTMSDFMSTNIGAIAKFETLLRDVADVYGVSSTAMQIHYDAEGPCIAFNTNGSIFCNLRFYLQLHYQKMTSSTPRAVVDGRVEATIWWFVVVAHELAHNLVSAHDANHSYYTESFVQEYFAKMMAKALSWQQGAAGNSSNNNSNNVSLIDTSIPGATSVQGTPLPPPPPYS